MPRANRKHRGYGEYHRRLRGENFQKIEDELDKIEIHNLQISRIEELRKWPSLTHLIRLTNLNYRTVRKIVKYVEETQEGVWKFRLLKKTKLRSNGRTLNQLIGIVYEPKSYTSFLMDLVYNYQLYEGESKTMEEARHENSWKLYI